MNIQDEMDEKIKKILYNASLTEKQLSKLSYAYKKLEEEYKREKILLFCQNIDIKILYLKQNLQSIKLLIITGNQPGFIKLIAKLLLFLLSGALQLTEKFYLRIKKIYNIE
jgi:hypothetical protein